MNYNKLSGDPSSLILGICSIVIGLIGCSCYGITAIIPLILGIIGLVIANKSIREYNANPKIFSPQSKTTVDTGRILNIIGIILNGIVVLIFIVILAFYGSVLSGTMLSEGFKNKTKTHENYDNEENVYEIEEENFERDNTNTSSDKKPKDSIN